MKLDTTTIVLIAGAAYLLTRPAPAPRALQPTSGGIAPTAPRASDPRDLNRDGVISDAERAHGIGEAATSIVGGVFGIVESVL